MITVNSFIPAYTLALVPDQLKLALWTASSSFCSLPFVYGRLFNYKGIYQGSKPRDKDFSERPNDTPWAWSVRRAWLWAQISTKWKRIPKLGRHNNMWWSTRNFGVMENGVTLSMQMQSCNKNICQAILHHLHLPLTDLASLATSNCPWSLWLSQNPKKEGYDAEVISVGSLL